MSNKEVLERISGNLKVMDFIRTVNQKGLNISIRTFYRAVETGGVTARQRLALEAARKYAEQLPAMESANFS